MRTLAAVPLFVLLLTVYHGVSAQPSGAEARKPYTRCSAVFGAAGYLTESKEEKDAYGGNSLTLGLWASELDPAIDLQEAKELTAREFAAELVKLGPEIKLAKEQPTAAAAQEFRARLNAELETCKTFFREAADKHKKK